MTAPLMASVQETMELLGISKWMVNDLIKSGTLSSVTIGGRRLVHVSAIAKAMNCPLETVQDCLRQSAPVGKIEGNGKAHKPKSRKNNTVSA